MIWFYRLLFLPGLLIALPYYLLRMWRRGGYGKDFQHRLGRFRRLAPPATDRKRVWLQAVSVGEVLAIGPLIEALQRTNQFEIVLTTTTSTGYAEARKRYADRTLAIGVFPLDFWLFSRKAWKRIQPDMLILTESELWPEHLHQAKAHKVPAYLVNARISNRSFERYQKVPTIAARMLRKFDAIFAASPLDQSRLGALGAANENIKMHGSIKFDVSIPDQLTNEQKNELLAELGFKAQNEAKPFVLLGSSTWPAEEAALIAAQDRLIAKGIDCRLLLVPRHAERAPEIVRLLNDQSRTWHQRSTQSPVAGPVSIYLADTTGELARLSQVADLAFIGKSLPPNHGGQTPIEAAGLGIPSIMGPEMANFKDLSRSLVQVGAARQVADAPALEAAILELANDQAARAQMGETARSWHASNRGSSQRIVDEICARSA